MTNEHGQLLVDEDDELSLQDCASEADLEDEEADNL